MFRYTMSRVSLCVALTFFFFMPWGWANADSNFAQDEHPAGRYRRENLNNPAIAHWGESPVVQFVGLKDDATKQHALSTLLPLAKAAREDIRIVGFPNDMFPKKAKISAQTNILLIETPNSISSDIYFVPKAHISGASSVIKEIAESGVFKQLPGCYGRWSATESNEIRGVVAVIDGTIPEEHKRVCLSITGLFAFGLSNTMTGYKFTFFPYGSDVPKTARYSDDTEFLLALSMAAICRKELSDDGNECPFELMQGIFQKHAEWFERAK